MFDKYEMKLDYKILLNSQDEILLKKYGNKEDYYLDERYKLAILIDIFSGYYDPELKSDHLATEYSKVLIAFCHFDGKWIPEGRFRCNPPKIHTDNSILVAGKKFESISESITTLLHGKEQQASYIILNCYKFKKNGDNLLDLFEEYKKSCFCEERAIIIKCFDPVSKNFDVSKYIDENKQTPSMLIL